MMSIEDQDKVTTATQTGIEEADQVIDPTIRKPGEQSILQLSFLLDWPRDLQLNVGSYMFMLHWTVDFVWLNWTHDVENWNSDLD